jgi:translocation and assembly module TamA
LPRSTPIRAGLAVMVLSAFAAATVPFALAEQQLEFQVTDGGDDLKDVLRQSSLLVQTKSERDHTAQDLFAAARADYARILAALYAQGRYSGEVRILIDGREAASIAPLDAPDNIGKIAVLVDPGPIFSFSAARVSPLAGGTELPSGFAVGEPAQSGLISEAANAGIDGWRNLGHAKAVVADQSITANHPARTLAADIRLAPGPVLRFGPLTIEGAERMRLQRIRKIAGLPLGEVYSPDELRRAADRLRRSGVFQSVSLVEDDAITAPDSLGITAVLIEEKKRRYRFGAEVATDTGVSLTGEWLHRNLLGGGERLTIDGAISNLGAQNSGVDYNLGIALERPATPGPDTTGRLALDLAHVDEADYTADAFDFGLTFRHYFSDQLTARAGIEYSYIEGRDDVGDFRFRNLSLPLGATWDRRNDAKNATRGFYLDAEAKPFLGFGTTGSGLRLTFDGRAYRGFGTGDRVVLAARLQGGAIAGSDLLDVPRDDLFYSGGGGTVRGQPYQSLGVTVSDGINPDYRIGGTQFLAGSVELRTKITEKIGLVGFLDTGYVAASGSFTGSGEWHSGAGLGLRYDTGFGPIRVDIAGPVGGGTGDGAQIYVGLGQSF